MQQINELKDNNIEKVDKVTKMLEDKKSQLN